MFNIRNELAHDGANVWLGPDVDLDFSELPDRSFPIQFGRCVSLLGVAFIPDDRITLPTTPSTNPFHGPLSLPADPKPDRVIGSARTSKSRGPILRFAKHLPTFLEIKCVEGGAMNDGARISGFRIHGRNLGQQQTSEVGIRVMRCVDIEISNMEIAGWGGSAISIEDDIPSFPLAESEPGGRITAPNQIRIHDNFIHHNQHPSEGGHAQGYGIAVSHGAWAQIYRNVFDHNRHSIMAAGDSGGYEASLNLVLKGGGIHGYWYTHSFDVHGTGCDTLCGYAGVRHRFLANAFQYRKGNAIKIRGLPGSAYIGNNIFPHPGLENDWGDDAVYLHTSRNVTLGPGNIIEFDSFGKYDVCDFDGDGVDDLFLATGATWWFSSAGEFHWTYLTEAADRLDQVRLGYVDDDARCDVIAERQGQWGYFSGGARPWIPLGRFEVPLTETVMGRFDPNDRVTQPGRTKRTTHAFRREADTGQWKVTRLLSPLWTDIQSSDVPMSKLQFGDFTGDGVTDVLAVVSGRWAISKSGIEQWWQLNPTLGDPVENLYIANMDHDDNIDDILKLDRDVDLIPFDGRRIARTRLTWWRSKNGVEPWKKWKEYVFSAWVNDEYVIPSSGFAGRFGPAPGGGTLVIDPERVGRFYSSVAAAMGKPPDWKGLFPY
jgi:hypothetical protein